MWKVFLTPLWIIITVWFLGALGIASDIAQLTDFNILDFIRKHAPHSYVYLVLGTIIIYLISVVVGLTRENSQSSSSNSEEEGIKQGYHISQTITNRDVSNSTIIQTGRDNKE